MTQFEIKERIDENNKAIQEMLQPNVFSLNNAVSSLIAENQKLQAECKHIVDNEGFCIYCYKDMNNYED